MERAHTHLIPPFPFQNGWWNGGNQSAPWCVDTWDAGIGKVPMGIPAFQKAFGLPFQLYAPYFCSDTSYLANWSMIRSDTTLPICGVSYKCVQ